MINKLVARYKPESPFREYDDPFNGFRGGVLGSRPAIYMFRVRMYTLQLGLRALHPCRGPVPRPVTTRVCQGCPEFPGTKPGLCRVAGETPARYQAHQVRAVQQALEEPGEVVEHESQKNNN